MTIRNSEFQKSVTTLWTATGLTLFYITFNTWADNRGTTFELPLNVFKNFDGDGELLFVIPFCSVLLGVMFVLGEHYADEVRQNEWLSRVPWAFAEKLPLDLNSSVGVWYQRFFFFIFYIFPFAGIVHFVLTFVKREIHTWDYSENYSIFHFDFQNSLNSTAYRFEGLSYFPVLQPLLYLILLSWTLYRGVKYFLIMFPSRDDSKGSSGKGS